MPREEACSFPIISTRKISRPQFRMLHEKRRFGPNFRFETRVSDQARLALTLSSIPSE